MDPRDVSRFLFVVARMFRSVSTLDSFQKLRILEDQGDAILGRILAARAHALFNARAEWQTIETLRLAIRLASVKGIEDAFKIRSCYNYEMLTFSLQACKRNPE